VQLEQEDFTNMNRDDIANYTVAEKLRDHRTATIRAIRPGNKELF
jgi:hypothetical protein